MATISPVYRDETEGARVRYDELLARWNTRRADLAGASSVLAIRAGRIWAGNAGILCAAALVAMTTTRFLHARHLDGRDALAGVPTAILAIAWPVMLLALAIGRARGRAMARALVEPPRSTADIREDARRMEEADLRCDVRDRADALERASVSRPMIAISLLAPLTIHLIVSALFRQSVEGFDSWIGMSLAVVGHAHLTLAFLGWKFARDARSLPRGALAGPPDAGWPAYGYTVLASAIPGAILFLVPPILTALTGLFIASPMFGAMSRALVRERHVLGVY